MVEGQMTQDKATTQKGRCVISEEKVNRIKLSAGVVFPPLFAGGVIWQWQWMTGEEEKGGNNGKFGSNIWVRQRGEGGWLVGKGSGAEEEDGTERERERGYCRCCQSLFLLINSGGLIADASSL